MKTPSPELLELCGAVRDETATPEQVTQLEGLLANNPEARRFYRRFTQVSAMLERYEQLTTTGPSTTAPARRVAWRFAGSRNWLALAACLVVLATLYFVRQPAGREATGDPTATATTATPASTVVAYIHEASACVLIPREGPPIEFSGSFQLRPGDIVTTAANGSAILRFQNENTLFILAADTRAWLSREGATRIMHLASGQISCDVAPQSEGSEWRIITADGEAKVLGTRLAVNAQNGGTRVAVTAGRVLVTARDSRQSVETPAGFATQLTPTTAVLTRLPQTEPTRVESFTLVDADTNASLAGYERLRDGTVLDLATLPTRRLNVRANCEPQLVGAVLFALTGIDPAGNPLKLVVPRAHSFPNQIEAYYPYMLAGDPSFEGEPLPAYSYPWIASPGRYTMTATPYAVMKQSGARGESLTVHFEIVESAARQ